MRTSSTTGAARSDPFQIPMRGNEIIEAARSTMGYIEFQIPMRGNEE